MFSGARAKDWRGAQRFTMKEEKFKKIIVGVTAAAVILLAILLVFMIYQLIAISVRNKRIAELEEQYAYWQAYIENAESDIEKYEGHAWLEIIARKLGMLGKDDFVNEGSVYVFDDRSALALSRSGDLIYEICGD